MRQVIVIQREMCADSCGALIYRWQKVDSCLRPQDRLYLNTLAALQLVNSNEETSPEERTQS